MGYATLDELFANEPRCDSCGETEDTSFKFDADDMVAVFDHGISAFIYLCPTCAP